MSALLEVRGLCVAYGKVEAVHQAGLRYQEKRALADLLRRLKSEGMSILLVEHDMDFVMKLVDRLVVMDFGEKLAEGLPQEIQANPVVLEAYLGGVK